MCVCGLEEEQHLIILAVHTKVRLCDAFVLMVVWLVYGLVFGFVVGEES